MKIKEINIDEYFTEVIDEGGVTIGYAVQHPEFLLSEIHELNSDYKKLLAQNDQLTRKLKTAENALSFYASSSCGQELGSGKYGIPVVQPSEFSTGRFCMGQFVPSGPSEVHYVIYDANIAKNALEEIRKDL